MTVDVAVSVAPIRWVPVTVGPAVNSGADLMESVDEEYRSVVPSPPGAGVAVAVTRAMMNLPSTALVGEYVDAV